MSILLIDKSHRVPSLTVYKIGVYGQTPIKSYTSSLLRSVLCLTLIDSARAMRPFIDLPVVTALVNAAPVSIFGTPS